MRETLVQILDDDARIVQNQVPVDQRRDAVIRIQVEQIFRQLVQVAIDELDGDAFLGEHQAGPMTPRVIRRRE